MVKVTLALGANWGDPVAQIRAATDELCRVLTSPKCAPIYQSAPMYKADQPDFFNTVISGQTELGPAQLFHLVKSLERKLGRMERERNGPREIDLDIITYGNLRYQRTGETVEPLIIPHPRLGERLFVLQPLFDIESELWIPGHGLAADLLAHLGSVQRLVKL